MADPDKPEIDAETLRSWDSPNLSVLYGPEGDGAAAWRVTLGPKQRITPPKPAGDGYYVVVIGGSWIWSDNILPKWSLAFAAQGEGAPELLAGDDGLDAMILQFPNKLPTIKDPAEAGGMHECPLCGYVYDEKGGDPGAGIEAGTVFADISEDWTCPNCDAPKSDFEAI